MAMAEGYKIRILAFIDRFDPPEDDTRGVGEWIRNDMVKGFWLDATIQMEGPKGTTVLDHIGDGKTYETLEDAEGVLLNEMGITLERLPVPVTPAIWSCAAYFIGELGPTGKSEAQVFAESGLPLRNLDRSRTA